MPSVVYEIFGLLGFLLSALGLLVFGFGAGRVMLDAYNKAVWQVQIALSLGFFGLLIGLAHFTTPGSTGMFALGAGIAYVLSGRTPKEKGEGNAKKK